MKCINFNHKHGAAQNAWRESVRGLVSAGQVGSISGEQSCANYRHTADDVRPVHSKVLDA